MGAIARVGIDCTPALPPKPAHKDDHDVDADQSEADAGFWPDYIPPDD